MGDSDSILLVVALICADVMRQLDLAGLIPPFSRKIRESAPMT